VASHRLEADFEFRESERKFMGFPFVLPEGVTLEDLWAFLTADKVALGWNDYSKVWFASNGCHCRAGNSPEEALYYLSIAGFETIVKKKQIA
jgi:hypothetical protein